MKDVVGFTGTQHRNRPEQLAALYKILSSLREDGSLWMHNGDCINSDHEAGIAWQAMGGKVHLHPPTNYSKRAFLHPDEADPEKSYLARNRDIVNSSTLLVATPREFDEQQRGGTWSTIRYARLRGTPIIIIWPDGTHTVERPAHD